MKTIIEFTRNGFTHRQLKRSGQIALIERFKGTIAKPEQLHFEVVRIRAHDGYIIGGREIPPGESYPSSEAWGIHGFTYRDRDEAEAKFAEMAGVE